MTPKPKRRNRDTVSVAQFKTAARRQAAARAAARAELARWTEWEENVWKKKN